MIEEAHDVRDQRAARSTWTSCTISSRILIERETIDKDQFERLLAGEAEESVFAEVEAKAATPTANPRPREKPLVTPAPRPLPGAAMQPPEGAAG